MSSYTYLYEVYSIVLWVLLLFQQITPVFAQVTAVEQRIVQSVDNRAGDAMALLEETVNINSGTMNFAGVKRVGQIFRTRLDALDFETRWVDGTPFGRAGHLVAEHKGRGKTILLIGHLDTVFDPSSPFQRFEMENDSTMRGPGVADMKGGDVVIIHALQALHDVGALKDMNIIVVMSGDEEMSGKPLTLSRHDLIEAAKVADIAIGFEDGDGDPQTAVIARRSSSGWKLKVTGTPAHSSQIFTTSVGAGAIYEIARILNSFYTSLSKTKNLTFNPGMLLAGTRVSYDRAKKTGSAYGKSNVVAKDAVTTGDLRALSNSQLAYAREVMQQIVDEHRPGTRAEIIFTDSYPPLEPLAGNYRLLSYFDKVSRDLGFGKVAAANPRDAGAADISFTAGYVDMAMDGLGLGGSGGHTVDEQADPRMLIIQTKRAAVLLHRLTRGE